MVQKSISYTYDFAGNKIEEDATANGETTYTCDVYDGGQVLLEVSDTNAVFRHRDAD